MKKLSLLLALIAGAARAQILQISTLYWSPVTNAVAEGYSNQTYSAAFTAGYPGAPILGGVTNITGTSLPVSQLIPSNYPSGPVMLWVSAQAQKGGTSNSLWLTMATATNYQAPSPPASSPLSQPPLMKVQ